MLLYPELSDQILTAMNRVHRTAGPGLVESIYEKSLEIELMLQGITIETQKLFKYYYRDHFVGNYRADIVVDNKIIIELKSVTELNRIMEAQLINYLRISQLKVGYLVNFRNASLTFKRFVV